MKRDGIVNRVLAVLSAVLVFAAPISRAQTEPVLAAPAAKTSLSVSPAIATQWAAAIGDYFRSSHPDVRALHGVVSAIGRLDISEPHITANIAPVTSEVRAQTARLLTSGAAPESIAQAKIHARDINYIANPDHAPLLADAEKLRVLGNPAILRFLEPNQQQEIAKYRHAIWASEHAILTSRIEAMAHELRPQSSSDDVEPAPSAATAPAALAPQLQTMAGLRALLVENPSQAAFSPFGFQALVEGLPEAQSALIDAVKSKTQSVTDLKSTLYVSLALVYQNAAPAAERQAVASFLLQRYALFFDQLRSEPDIPSSLRRKVEDAYAKLADPNWLLAGLAQARQAQDQWQTLQKTYLSLRSFESDPAAARGMPQWQIPPVISPEDRGHGGIVQHSIYLRDSNEWIKDNLFALDLLKAIRSLTEQQRLAIPLALLVDRQIQFVLSRLQDTLGALKLQIDRFPSATIYKTFLNEKPRKIYHIPTHPGLSLTPEPGGFVLRARFKTDIMMPEVHETVRRSIESYWSGPFTHRGNHYNFRTKITIEPLRDGEAFPSDYLRLVDAKDSVSHASPTGIALGRNFNFGTPAHEFGHVLGLSDLYTEVYDPGTISAIHTKDETLLMASSGTGKVTSDDLKLVYRLLRRHRLSDSRPKGESRGRSFLLRLFGRKAD